MVINASASRINYIPTAIAVALTSNVVEKALRHFFRFADSPSSQAGRSLVSLAISILTWKGIKALGAGLPMVTTRSMRLGIVLFLVYQVAKSFFSRISGGDKYQGLPTDLLQGYLLAAQQCSSIQATQRHNPQSHGLLFASDHSTVLCHDRTMVPVLYRVRYGKLSNPIKEAYGLPSTLETLEGMNMDRAFVAERQDGTHFACICDGVSSGGILSMHAAQGFIEYALPWLLQKNHLFREAKNNAQIGRQLFSEMGSIPSPAQSETPGAATCGFVTITQKEDRLFLHGAAIGDVIILLLNVEQRAIRQINLVQRQGESLYDSGGQITWGRGIDYPEKISNFMTPLTEKEIVILATDGLMDNLRGIRLIRSIAYNSRFDNPVCLPPWTKSTLPDEQELQDILETNTTSQSISPKNIVERLRNYVFWVTQNKRDSIQNKWKKQVEKQDTPSREDFEHIRDEVIDTQKAGKLDDLTIIAMYPKKRTEVYYKQSEEKKDNVINTSSTAD